MKRPQSSCWSFGHFAEGQQRKKKKKKFLHYCSLEAGKIQGDGRKILDSFKSYFVFESQISSQSLNEVYIYYLSITAEIRNKRWVFSYIFVFDCFELVSWIANDEQRWQSAARSAALLNKLRQLKTTKCMEKLQSENVESWVWLSCTKEAFTLLLGN